MVLLNVKKIKLKSEVNKIRFLVLYEFCNCKYRLDENVYNPKQNWNYDKCWCGCKKLVDCNFCRNNYMWNPSKSDSESDKIFKTNKYFDVKNCLLKKCLFIKLGIIIAWED